MSRPTHQWCPACREESAVDRDLKCLWCGGATRAKRRSTSLSKLTDDQVRVLHSYHLRGVSAAELGRRIYRKVGYASPASAQMGILEGFRRLGLDRRPQPEATSLANRGRSLYEDSPGTADRAAYKRWWRRKQGRARKCAGVTGTGEPCGKWAAPGSEFCWLHAPSEVAA